MIALPLGMQLSPTRHLEPRLERDTFSGGTNLTRRKRNIDAIQTSAETFYVFRPGPDPITGMKQPEQLIGPRFGERLLDCKVATGPALDEAIDRLYPLTWSARIHPAAREWYVGLVEQSERRRAAEMTDHFERRHPLARGWPGLLEQMNRIMQRE